MSPVRTAALIAAAVASCPAHAAVMGSELIDRNLVDAAPGLSLIYRGDSQPLAGDGAVPDQFGVYARGLGTPGGGQFWITPFLLEVTGVEQYTVVAIGTSRDLSGELGALSFDFDTIAGNATLEAGKSYTFGYRNAQHEFDGNSVSTVAGTQNIGSVPFTGYGDYSDLWSYASAADLDIGTIFGNGGNPLDANGFDGRIYSAQFSTIPTPTGTAALACAAFVAVRRRR